MECEGDKWGWLEGHCQETTTSRDANICILVETKLEGPIDGVIQTTEYMG